MFTFSFVRIRSHHPTGIEKRMLKHVGSTSPVRSQNGRRWNKEEKESLVCDPMISSSRCSSYSSLCDGASLVSTVKSQPSPMKRMAMMKIYARCLRPDVEYKTLLIGGETTSGEVIRTLIQKCRLPFNDPNLYILTMEVGLKRGGVDMKTVLLLDDSARPMDLAAIHTEGKFCLRMRPGGGTLDIYDPAAASAAALSDHSHFKSLFVSERTTAEQVIRLLLDGYDNKDDEKHFSLYEVPPHSMPILPWSASDLAEKHKWMTSEPETDVDAEEALFYI
ncbi:unnamed protein product [Darwinula stevensoni]|uniref:Ras-associating domain-containing protein n=1 Tax=Darwinula stevensoni TaxID=69355 RepID=A0A7R9FRH8_9CRUS|nr:unnamed protein product [Darwinula stevensoni]CAG0901706.1 unnamed protein product [Darwinula stevensoni]